MICGMIQHHDSFIYACDVHVDDTYMQYGYHNINN
ncbi:unnamed protein product [Musa acuminata subsp. malaccensis]|uniref:(wild Malaysian banana) hypothetical protein n=1 Tax=Musa acuminata subsp. malaccensis TaxID=214687 RepID=A0A804J0Q3_MUSAM|nr:unnamed protein product [Musa acuminata subsp. malaccensis]